ncbi:hypothetical protein FRC14_002882 [Serendipita sp. 396]|nr:hypothetical protein FRC14_002882 [Serendipita sp. 396]KAG8803638.1 hypothetical protein FRC16_004190 [Serendipita sp. 398]KAG8809447.1 hypothetical protein FRC18_004543 [Serendipita sp. 400]KAG8818889.1 hypothetical protein FRC19_010257 [Serendipita sp. 401]KAG8848222.1 hypothetical protein FRB91_011006 [Serendipita sp. 411]KAG8874852.1 hypothetical protein FRC20_004966 [Serendipita sp. 405]KAG9052732.1 hypothetical protein FS842_009338 [Serendipita sp. 407]
MPSVEFAERVVASYRPSYIPNAVFIGGTSGMGRAMLEALAKQTNGRVNIWIVGRNKTVAEEIIASIPSPPLPEGSATTFTREFVQCDVSLLRNVQAMTQELLRQTERKINILVITSGKAMYSRVETADGLDLQMMLRYYSRFKMIEDLVPALENAHALGQDARVMTVLAAGVGLKVPIDDLDLKKWYNYLMVHIVTGVYNDIMVKVQSERHPNLTFIHVFPGIVNTPATRVSLFTRAIAVLSWYWIKQVEPIAQSFLYPLLSSEDFKRGGYWISQSADKLPLASNITDEVAKKVWDHSVERTTLRKEAVE